MVPEIVRFSKIVNKSITDVTEDDLIFYLAGMGTEGRRGVRSCVKVFYQWGMKRGFARCNPADSCRTRCATPWNPPPART